jgi:cobalt-zinc-cadmium efflux system outer membrane protein
MVETTRRAPLRSVLTVGWALMLAVTPLAATDATDRPTGDGPRPLEATRDFHVPDQQLAAFMHDLLDQNPEVRAAEAFTLSVLDRVPQQRSLPDPLLSYRLFLSEPETRVGPQIQGAEFSQTLPWFGKRELQAERAGHVAGAVSWQAQELQRSLVAELKRVYFDAAYLQEALAINAEEAELLRRFEQIALIRYSTGGGIQQSVIKVQTDITRLAAQATALGERLGITQRKIAELLGRPESDLALRSIRLALPDVRFDRAQLETESVEQNPTLFARQRQIEADRAWVRRRHREAYPDFSVGIGYIDVGRREDTAGTLTPPEDNGKDIWALTVKLNIPLYRGRIRAGVAEANHSLQSNQSALKRTQDELRSGVRESALRLESLDEQARLFRDVLIPQAGQSLASAEAAYTTNRQGFLDLLDAERVLFQVRLTYHRLLSDYWISLAELERTIARAFPEQPAEEGKP